MKKKRAMDKLSLLYSIVDLMRLLLICAIVACLLMMFVGRKEVVKGKSMHPTLKDGESVIINVAASYLCKIQRFDVVVAKNYKHDDYWVKRVVGLPGEIVSYQNDNLYIDGKKMKESFLNPVYLEKMKKNHSLKNFTEDFESRKLADDEYLLVGDNRIDSFDSRNESVGPFKREQIIAKGMIVYNPLSEMRYIGNDS